MSDDNSNVIEFTSLAARDAELLSRRLSGVSLRALAAEFRLTEKQVLDALDETLPKLDGAARARYFREALGQLDQLQSWWYAKSQDSPSAAAILLKIQERRSALIGLDAAVHVRIDPVTLVAAGAEPQGSSTAELLRMLDHIERPQPKLVEHEAAPELPPSDGGPAT